MSSRPNQVCNVVNISFKAFPNRKDKFLNFPVIKPKRSLMEISQNSSSNIDADWKKDYEIALIKSIKESSLHLPRRVFVDSTK